MIIIWPYPEQLGLIYQKYEKPIRINPTNPSGLDSNEQWAFVEDTELPKPEDPRRQPNMTDYHGNRSQGYQNMKLTGFVVYC